MNEKIKKFVNSKRMNYVYITCIILFSLRNIGTLNNIWILNDEFGYWSLAATFAGKDWGGLIPYTPYYAWGYSLLLVPLFWMFSDTVLLYKAAIVLNALLLAGCYGISVLVGKKLLPELKEGILRFFCFAVCFYPNTMVQTQGAWTEVLLIFLFWLAVYTLINVSEKVTLINSVAFAFILCYMYSVHQRTLGILLAGVITYSILLLSRHIPKRCFWSFIFVFAGGILLISVCKSNIKSELWSVPQIPSTVMSVVGNEVKNTVSSLSNANDYGSQIHRALQIFTFDGAKNFIFGLMGRFYYLMICAGPIMLWTSLYLYRQSKDIVLKIVKKDISKVTNVQWCICFMILSLVSSVAICIISMNYKVRYDAPFYSRYFENTLSPFILIGLTTLYMDMDRIKKYISYLVLLLLSMIASIQIIKDVPAPSFFNSICATSLGRYLNADNVIVGILIATTVAAVVSVFLIILFYNRRSDSIYRVGISMIGILILLGYWGLSIHSLDWQYASQRESIQHDIDHIAQVVQKYPESSVYYIRDGEYDTYGRNAKFIQYLIPNRKIEVINYEDISYYKEKLKRVIILVDTGNETLNDVKKQNTLIQETDLLTIYKN